VLTQPGGDGALADLVAGPGSAAATTA